MHQHTLLYSCGILRGRKWKHARGRETDFTVFLLVKYIDAILDNLIIELTARGPVFSSSNNTSNTEEENQTHNKIWDTV